MQNSMNSIVIGADHYNTLWVIRTLGYCGFKPSVIIYSPNVSNAYVLKSRYVGNSWMVKDVESIMNILRDELIQGDVGKTFLFTTSDTIAEVIDKHYDELADRYVLSNCKDGKVRLGYWMDKWNMNGIAHNVGFNIPWTKSIDLMTEDALDVSEIHFPCILKPLKSLYGTKYDVRICHSAEEYRNVIRSMKGKCNYYIAQEYIHPDYELTIDGMRSRRADCALFPGVILKDRTCNSTHNLGMVALAHLEKDVNKYIDPQIMQEFLRTIDYDGLCSFDLFVKDGRTYFLEVNLRTDGDMFIYTKSGINFPLLWMRLSQGIPLEPEDFKIQKEQIYGMIEFSYMKYMPWRTPWRIVSDWWKTDCYSIFSWNDIKPFFYKFIYAI